MRDIFIRSAKLWPNFFVSPKVKKKRRWWTFPLGGQPGAIWQNANKQIASHSVYVCVQPNKRSQNKQNTDAVIIITVLINISMFSYLFGSWKTVLGANWGSSSPRSRKMVSATNTHKWLYSWWSTTSQIKNGGKGGTERKRKQGK